MDKREVVNLYAIKSGDDYIRNREPLEYVKLSKASVYPTKEEAQNIINNHPAELNLRIVRLELVEVEE